MRRRGNNKRPKKVLKRGLGAKCSWVGLQAFRAFVRLLPMRLLPPVGRALGRKAFVLMGPRRRIALNNVELSLGSRSEAHNQRIIVRSSMENLGMSFVEAGHMQYLRPESLRRFVAVEGREHLDEALQKGRGAILVTAHFGNFPLFMMKLGLEGYSIGVIVRNPRYRLTARFLDHYRARFGIRSLKDKPRRISVKEALAFLRDNGVLVLHVDVNVSHGGMFVPFFGHWVPTFRGPAQLSLHAKAPALPTFIRRVHGLHHRMTIHPPLSFPPTGDREEDTWRLLWGLTRKTEDAIREHPEQYFWLHRRFRKERPCQEVGRPLPDMEL